LEQQLCLFSRDEVLTWLHAQKQPAVIDLAFRQRVEENTASVVQRASNLACTIERQQQLNGLNGVPPPGPSPVQSVTNMIAQATNPLNLVKMTEMYNPWF
jgi:transformation/transcription domain-associated protein